MESINGAQSKVEHIQMCCYGIIKRENADVFVSAKHAENRVALWVGVGVGIFATIVIVANVLICYCVLKRNRYV